MGAISEYGRGLIGKYFFFKFIDDVSIIGKIKDITVDKDYKRSPTANYSLIWKSTSSNWGLYQFSLGSGVDKRCIIFDELGNMTEFFNLFLDSGGSKWQRTSSKSL